MAMKRIIDLDALVGALNAASLLEIETPTGDSLKIEVQDILDLVDSVAGPAGAADGGVALFDGVTGKLLKDGGALGTAAFVATTAFDASGLAASAQASAESYADGLAATKQDTLVSATNIKTINGISLLGSGDVTVSGTGGASVGVQFTADLSATADADPGAGKLRWNNATQASATVLFLDDATVDGASLTGWWPALDAGGFMYAQHPTTQNKWQIWEIGTVTDATGYAKLAVTLLAAGAAFAASDPILVTLQQGPGGGGGFSNPMTTAGDTLYAGASNVPTRLAKGTNGAIYTQGATYPSWVVPLITNAKSTATPNATINAYSITPASGTNSDIAVVPNGSGAFMLGVPNNAVGGGDKRGLRSVDLTVSRSYSNQVASGNDSFQFGKDAKASADYSTALGWNSAATGTEAVAMQGATAGGYQALGIGTYANAGGEACIAIGQSAYATEKKSKVFCASDEGTKGIIAWGPEYVDGGRFRVGDWLGSWKTTDATAARLASNGYGTDAAAYFIIPTDSVQHIKLHITARQTAGSGAGTVDAWTGELLIKNIGGTVSLAVSPTMVAIGSSGWTVAVTADNTNKSLNITVTGAASKTIEWRARAFYIEG